MINPMRRPEHAPNTTRRIAKLVLTAGLTIVAGLTIAAFIVGRPVPTGKPKPVKVARPRPAEMAAATTPPPSSAIAIKRILEIRQPFVAGDWYWDDQNVPSGPMVITIDTAAQTLSVFRGGYEIGTAVVTYGADEYPTPLGTFPITQKDADHVSNLYGAPMPYMLRLTNDGVSVHGAPISFDYATHGCVGVPIPFAKLLFDAVKLGDRVIVTRGKMMEVDARSPNA